MLEIITRRVVRFIDVKIKHNNTTIDLDLQNVAEATDLRRVLHDAVVELDEYIEDQTVIAALGGEA